MVSTEVAGFCKKHPDHYQQPGVCSCCLREKLSGLYSTSFYPNPKSAPWTMEAITSCPSSFSSSPTHSKSQTQRGHQRNASIGFIVRSGSGCATNSNEIMRKSRSLVFVSRNKGGAGKKRSGFWSKLLHPTGKTTSSKEVLKNPRVNVK